MENQDWEKELLENYSVDTGILAFIRTHKAQWEEEARREGRAEAKKLLLDDMRRAVEVGGVKITSEPY